MPAAAPRGPPLHSAPSALKSSLLMACCTGVPGAGQEAPTLAWPLGTSQRGQSQPEPDLWAGDRECVCLCPDVCMSVCLHRRGS